MGSYTPPPTVDVIITPKDSGSRAMVLVSSALLGHTRMVPMGRFDLDLDPGSLVGLSAAAAALKALRPVCERLQRIVDHQTRPKASAAPQGGPQGGLVNVPLPGLEPSTLT